MKRDVIYAGVFIVAFMLVTIAIPLAYRHRTPSTSATRLDSVELKLKTIFEELDELDRRTKPKPEGWDPVVVIHGKEGMTCAFAGPDDAPKRKDGGRKFAAGYRLEVDVTEFTLRCWRTP